MTSKATFTDDEWDRVRRAPIVAGMAITIADPGGPIEISKEMMATLRAATVPPSQEELLAAVALDIQALAQQKQNPARNFKPTGADDGTEILDELRAVDAIVAEKATPEETQAFAVGSSWRAGGCGRRERRRVHGLRRGAGQRRGAEDAGSTPKRPGTGLSLAARGRPWWTYAIALPRWGRGLGSDHPLQVRGELRRSAGSEVSKDGLAAPLILSLSDQRVGVDLLEARDSRRDIG